MKHYASPNGSAGNAGTELSPWDLQTALEHSSILPGATVFLRGGTYKHPNRAVSSKGYFVRLQGAAGNPIVVRPYPGERAIIDGGIQSDNGTPGNHYRIQGLEVLTSENLTQSRTTTNPGSDAPPDLVRPWGGMDFRLGNGVELVHNYVHDNFQGIGHWGSCSGLCYGNVIVHNGWIGPDRKHGAGIYGQNATGKWKSFRNNLLIDNYEENTQLYGSTQAAIDNVEWSDNVHFKGPITGSGRVLIGGDGASVNVEVSRNIGNHNLDVGYTGLNPSGFNLIVRDNRILGDLSQKPHFQNVYKPQGSNIWHTFGFSSPRTEGTHGDRVGVDTVWPNTVVKVERSVFDTDICHVSVLDPNASETSATVTLPFDGIYEAWHPASDSRFCGTGATVTLPLSGNLSIYVIRRTK